MSTTLTQNKTDAVSWDVEVSKPCGGYSIQLLGNENAARRFAYNLPDAGIHDVCIEAGGSHFFAHRYVLAAESGYFAGMFATDVWKQSVWKEGTEFLVKQNVDSRVLQAVLDYIYLGNYEGVETRDLDTSLQWDVSLPFFPGLLTFHLMVYSLAEYYQMDKLRLSAATRVERCMWACPVKDLHHVVRLVHEQTLPLPAPYGELTIRERVARYIAQRVGERYLTRKLAAFRRSSEEFDANLEKFAEWEREKAMIAW
ncbi:MAG: hypothetical protein M1831_000347 [Alyxoria varia]|nr:MAG: hypothetical protein M1831_000347 [Alyxoria varia]